MAMLIKIIGMLMIIEAVVFLLKPDMVKTMISFFARGKGTYLAAAVKGAFGAICLLAASGCNWPWFMTILGVISLLAAILIVARPDTVRSIGGWFSSRSQNFLRIYSIVCAVFGVLLVLAA